jgi:TolB-like protein
VSKAELMRQAWPGLVVEESNLSVQVAALRKAFGASPADGSEWIVTVPRVGYRLHGGVAVEDTQLAPLGSAEPDMGGRPRIAVLPFAHLGDDPAQEYLADGVTEALVTALTRFRWFFVTSRNASQVYKLKPADSRTAATELGVRYLVEGSVRQLAGRIRISAQLVDAASGTCLWADRHELADGDLFDAQDAIAQQVAGAIEPELLRNAGSAAASGAA